MLKNEKICLKGCNFIGCSWKKKDGVYYPEIIADECTEAKKQHLITLKKNDNKWVCAYFNGFDGLLGAYSPIENNLIAVSKPIGGDSLVFSYQSATPISGDRENDLSTDLINVPLKAKTIGDHLYLAGWDRAIVRRDGANKWTLLSQETQTTDLKKIKDAYGKGFQDIDGFSEMDMYAVGGRGDVWRYDGEHWYRIDVPVNSQIHAVCCGGDGSVYIAGSGFLLKGRDNRWEIIQQDRMKGLRANDMVWFHNVLYISSWENRKLYQYKDGIFSDFPFKAGDIPDQFHSLAVCDEAMLSVGGQCISIFDGNKWENIYGGTTVEEKRERREIINELKDVTQNLRKAGEYIDDLKAGEKKR